MNRLVGCFYGMTTLVDTEVSFCVLLFFGFVDFVVYLIVFYIASKNMVSSN